MLKNSWERTAHNLGMKKSLVYRCKTSTIAEISLWHSTFSIYSPFPFSNVDSAYATVQNPLLCKRYLHVTQHCLLIYHNTAFQLKVYQCVSFQALLLCTCMHAYDLHIYAYISIYHCTLIPCFAGWLCWKASCSLKMVARPIIASSPPKCTEKKWTEQKIASQEMVYCGKFPS